MSGHSVNIQSEYQTSNQPSHDELKQEFVKILEIFGIYSWLLLRDKSVPKLKSVTHLL